MNSVRCRALKHTSYGIVLSLNKKKVVKLPEYFFVDIDLDSVKERDKGE